jgi:hypothetical protein
LLQVIKIEQDNLYDPDGSDRGIVLASIRAIQTLSKTGSNESEKRAARYEFNAGALCGEGLRNDRSAVASTVRSRQSLGRGDAYSPRRGGGPDLAG